MKQGDYIEVFCGHRDMPIRTVLNLDGTQNLTKLKAASKRTLREWIK